MKPIQTIEEAKDRIIFYQTMAILGAIFFILGMAMNFKVIVGNKGKMPVMSDFLFAGYNETHFIYLDKTTVRYWYLSDIIYVGKFIIFSIGDLFVWFGTGFIVFYSILNIKAIRKKRKLEKERRQLVSDENLAGPKRYNILLESINSIFKRLRN